MILTPPTTPTERDDGYLSASEIAQLKLDADWVILSARNTAAGGAEEAEPLSGLARAFFYVGARARLVSPAPSCQVRLEIRDAGSDHVPGSPDLRPRLAATSSKNSHPVVDLYRAEVHP